jgi:hypothetical protein
MDLREFGLDLIADFFHLIISSRDPIALLRGPDFDDIDHLSALPFRTHEFNVCDDTEVLLVGLFLSDSDFLLGQLHQVSYFLNDKVSSNSILTAKNKAFVRSYYFGKVGEILEVRLRVNVTFLIEDCRPDVLIPSMVYFMSSGKDKAV